MAKDYDMPVTSKMKRVELLNAVKEQLNHTIDHGQDREKADGVKASRSLSRDTGAPESTPPDTLVQLQSKTKVDLYKLAGEHHINGRSNMNKAELMHAIASEIMSPTTAPCVPHH